MKYLYYLVAALIFVAVVNLSARWFGSEPAPLAIEATGDGRAVDPANPEPAALVADDQPPVVAAGSHATQKSQADAQPAIAETLAVTEPASVKASDTPDSAPAVAPVTEPSVETPTLAVAPIVGATENQPTTATDTPLQALKAKVSGDAGVGTAPAEIDSIETDRLAAELIDDAAAAEATNQGLNQTGAIEINNSPSQAEETEAAAVIGAAIAQAKQAVSHEAEISPGSDTTDMDQLTAVEPEPPQAPAPTLVDSIVSSASSAADVVAEGAQSAVDTVVDAAGSLLDGNGTDSTAAELADSTPASSAGTGIADPTIAAAATTADAPVAVANPAQDAAPPADVQAPATDVAAATTEEVQPTSTEPTKTGSSQRTDRALAPAEVLELLERHPGKRLLLGFFSADCTNCRDSLRWLNEMRRQYWAKGLQVIGVNVGTEEAGKAFLADSPVSFEVLHDPQRQLAAAVWLAEQPSAYLIDSSGALLSMHAGHSELKLGQYEDNIRAALQR